MNIGIFGVGKFGETHIKVLQSIQEISIVGFFDPDKKRADDISKKYHIKSYETAKSLIEKCDAIDIVSNTNTHFDIIQIGIENNKHIFVEKPICSNHIELRNLTKQTLNYKPIIQVGHIERYNPATHKGFQDIQDVKLIKTKRVGLLNNRNKNTSIVIDLMIHDIDLIFSVVKSPIKSITAIGSNKINNLYNNVKCILTFTNNIQAELISERNYSVNTKRNISITCNTKIVEIDLLNRTITDAKENEVWKCQENANPLKMELIDFYNNVKKNTQPIVGIKESCKAVETALKIEEIIYTT